MRHPYLVTIAAVLAVVGGLGAVKAAQIGTLVSAGKKAAEQGPPPEVVATAVASKEAWEGTLSAVGSVASAKGVTIGNEVPGIVTRIAFDSGADVKQGDVLVELDTRVERAQLASAVARQELAATTARRSRALAASGSIAIAERDADETALEAATKDVAALRAQIAKKIIRAPFGGRLGIRMVDLGQYLAPGTPIAALEAVKTLVVDFMLPQQALGSIAVGMPVRIEAAAQAAGQDAGASPGAQAAPGAAADAGADAAAEAADAAGGAGGARTGAIEAIDPRVDPTTRAVKVRATVPNEDGAMRPGMFADVTVLLPQKAPVVIVPATAIRHAPYGDSVFVVEPKPEGAPGMRTTPDGKPVQLARQQFVRTGEARGDFVAIRDGVAAGQTVVTAGAFKLRNGAPIVVDNSVKPSPELHPTPENR